jgi:hypothetical protein
MCPSSVHLSAPSSERQTAFPTKPAPSRWGLVVRRTRWSLTWRGRALLVLLVTGLTAFIVLRIHPFLAVTQEVESRMLVVEGWISHSELRRAAELFKAGGYHAVFTTGGPTETNYDSTDISDTYASVAGHQLVEFGIPKSQIQIVPCWLQRRDRTYASAAALRDWCEANNVPMTAVNVATSGVHARRTRLMYQAAFGKGALIGIVAIEGKDYDPHAWWHYSEGVKEVISEGAAYLYARLFFWPGVS